jgi:membrane protease YdiL (CAAX protease family)
MGSASRDRLARGTSPVTSGTAVRDRSGWARLVIGLTLVFGLFEALGTKLRSDRGQFGIPIGAAVVALVVAVEIGLFRRPASAALAAAGLRGWSMRAMSIAILVSGLLIVVLPLFSRLSSVPLHLVPNWVTLVPGLFAQGGIAEETLFRGYLFGHLRPGRSFWQAATIAMVPFVFVHLLLFFTMPAPIAAAAVVLAAITSFPLAYLFELGGNTIWAPALVHATIQGAIKLIEIPPAAMPALPLLWMAAAAALPYLVFLVRTAETPAAGAPVSRPPAGR